MPVTHVIITGHIIISSASSHSDIQSIDFLYTITSLCDVADDLIFIYAIFTSKQVYQEVFNDENSGPCDPLRIN